MSSGRPLNWYLLSTACNLIPGGIQQVLFPFLVAVILQESAERVGIAQMSWQLPSLFLLLIGGVIGDRFDQRRILMATHLLAAIPPLTVAYLINSELLSFGVLLAYGLIGGVFTGLSQPARDALVNRVAGDQIQRTIIVVMTLQWTLQIVGFAIASLADSVGVVPLMVFQSVVMMSGALAIQRVRVAPAPVVRHEPPVRAIRSGLREATRSPIIRPAIMLISAVGVFFAGGYVVLLPLIVRDVYAGSAVDISMAFAANIFGTVVASLWMLRRGGVERPGRAVFLALICGCIVLLIAQLHFSLVGFYIVIFLWGLGGGVCMNMLRSVVQAASSTSHRARVMSVFSLGMMGGMPIGSLLMGFCAGALGALQALVVPALGVLCVVIYVYSSTDFASLRKEDLEVAA